MNSSKKEKKNYTNHTLSKKKMRRDTKKSTVSKNKDGSITNTYRKVDPYGRNVLQKQLTKYPNGYSFSELEKTPTSYRFTKTEYHGPQMVRSRNISTLPFYS